MSKKNKGMNEFWISIISSFLGAILALGGAFWIYKIQENQKINNIKASIEIELEDIENNLTKNQALVKSQGLTGTVQVMHNKIYYEPSNFDIYKADLSKLSKADFYKTFQLYRKIKEFEETRLFLIKKNENGIDLREISNKKDLTIEEQTTKMKMDIYENYFLNLDLIIEEINELQQIMK